MKVILRVILILTAFVVSITTQAQLGGLLQKGLDKGKKLATKSANESVDAAQEKLDSTDFNYAISVIDNSGMMDIRDANENAIKGASAVTNFGKSESDKTPAQKCHELLNAAEFDYKRRWYKFAELAFLQAKLAYENEGLTGNINYSKVQADLGLLYASMGRFNSADAYTSEALSIREQTLGKNSKAYASSLNNIAVLYQETAKFNEAEKYFEEALQTVKAQLGEQSQEYAIVLNNQSIFFSKIGRYDQAVAKLKSAIAIVDAQPKPNSGMNVGFQSNLALLYQHTGKFTDAEAIYLKLDKSLEKALANNNPYRAGVFDNLALLYIQMGQLDKVEDLFKKSAAIYKAKFGDQNPNYAKVLNDQGNFYRMQGRYAEAEQLLTQSLTIRATAFDTNHPDYVKSQEDLGILYWKKGDMAKAYTNLQLSMDKSIDFINRYFPPMSEAEKTKYWDVLQPRFQRFYNYSLEASATNPAVLQAMYDYQMATKGLLLNSTNKIKKAILASGNVDLIKDYVTWLDKKEGLARYYTLSKEELKNQKIDLAAAEQEANALERSLSQRSGDFSQGYNTEKISYKQVASLLGDNEAVVELIRVHTFDKNFTADSKYAALILTKNSEPKLQVLDNGNQLETRYAKFYRNAVQQKIADEYSYEQFWARIEPALVGKKGIYISPDGVYNQINLNTLKKTGADYVLNRYDLTLIGNSRDVIALKNQKPSASKKNAFLLGFPDYEGTAVAALPGTKVEIDGVSKTLKASGYTVTQLVQKDATEARLKSVKGPALLHIATHGYFQPDTDDGEDNAKANPLLRSGLLLAGASKTLSGEALPNLESNDNGILTAYEAMNLSLEGTDLIILSACETGLGDVRAGEGVYGLQRAFQVAGAKALVMSLWKVDDAATQALMTNFYTNLAKGGTKLNAFKQAQLQLMVKYKDPYYWGAFVMLGQ
jgi:CHAT domain-containing protein/Tfp pilus assembly protein PilF